MELKNFVRKGRIDESNTYRNLLRYRGGKPEHIVLLLEGKLRRKVRLTAKKHLLENYFPTSFVGLEDLLVGESRSGGCGVFPGSHYIVWQSEDFLNSVSVHPELARRAIFALSRRVRVYDDRHRKISMDLRIETHIEVGKPQEELTDALYQMSFSDDDEFPPHVIEKLVRKFSSGEYLMKQGDDSNELFIILEGGVSIYHAQEGEKRKVDTLKEHDMVGEMAQFDGLPRSADVIADTEVQVLEFKPENFHLLFQLHPKWSHRILETLANRIEQRRKDLEELDASSLTPG